MCALITQLRYFRVNEARNRITQTIFFMILSGQLLSQSYQYSRNMAILSKTHYTPSPITNGFCMVKKLNYHGVDNYFLIFHQYDWNGANNGYMVYNVSDPSNIIVWGKIGITPNQGGRDLSVAFNNSDEPRLFFTDSNPTESRIVSFKLTSLVLDEIYYNWQNNQTVTPYFTLPLHTFTINVFTSFNDPEMIYFFENKLYIATNKDFLSYLNVTDNIQPPGDKYNPVTINLIPPSQYPTWYNDS